MPGKLIAGNWKMNGLKADGLALARDLASRARQGAPCCDLLLCPPAQLLFPVGEAIAGTGIALGGQDCHTAALGAHTGDISAPMLADAGCSHVVVGHSERRSDHGESSGLVRKKAAAGLAAGLTPIVCIGETAAEREAGRALAVIEGQLRDSLPEAGEGEAVVIAYEPVWAIGTGKVATAGDVAEVHARIRGLLHELLGPAGTEVRILYGGSVKPNNAAELLAVDSVDGALVGGASLKAEDFWAIAASCP
ncbi:MAG: triose-phosphate isomerase [Rhodospirillales bacterium]|nr:triose-phosphate isomerase [Rhodospirillales bacterium]